MNSVDAYIAAIETPSRRQAMEALVEAIRHNLPVGFKEVIGYGMPAWVVPFSAYPNGYHANPKLPLPFLNLASQKRHIGLYHMGIYADPELLAWFQAEYPKHVSTKLNMGKSCIRFTNDKRVPVDLIGELCTKMDPQAWIERYEAARS